ncbi:MATE family efflux transporter [Rubrivirga sp. S365]|uniref:MATE family efflux transporter n=1 Tax=Rubrivirga sp. S365 TaxID=3076080 RepID=UPI0028C8049D|nr:MATE family efflux transporter [Rubrivirga sp. S365]MDT7855936.1 MATE family efflux transporter [Rubrivirga sp. S365]
MSRPALGREVRATLALAVPIVLVQLAQMSMSFIDVVMVGRLGTEALAAVVLASTTYVTASLVCVGVLVAVQPTVAQAVGAGDDAAAARGARQGLWLATILGVPFAIGLGFVEPVLVWTGQDPDTSALAGAYLRAIRWGFVPNLWFTALRGLAEGDGRPRAVLGVTLLGVAVNVPLNYALMFGALGLPALGLVGTGWGSAVSTTVMTAALAVYVRRGPLARFGVLADFRRPDVGALRELFALGWPIGVGFGMESGLFTAATLLVGRLPDPETALAAHQVALNAASVAFMVPLGIGMAGGIRVGQAVGAGDERAAARAGWTSAGLGAAFMACSALLFWLRPDLVVAVYAGPSPDPVVAALAASLLSVAAVFQLFDGVQAAVAGALRGLKDTRVPMLISAGAYWGVGLTTGVVLGVGAGWGARGLWWGLTLGLAAAAVALSARFARLTRVRPALA